MTLSDRVATLLPRTEYRRAQSEADRRAIFRLRHDAYLREGAIERHDSGLFTDPVDEASNTLLFGVHIDGTLVSAMRLSVSCLDGPEIPTAHVFPDELHPRLAEGKSIVDPTRFVADHAASRRFPELAYLTLRLPWMAMEHFEADYMLAAVRPEHIPFYRRLWGNEVWGPARSYPGLSKPVALSALDFAEARDTVLRKYPFFGSTTRERELIFQGFESHEIPLAAAETASLHRRG